jgi:hypothetical protein
MAESLAAVMRRPETERVAGGFDLSMRRAC